ncbi:hypothetical protein LTR10_016597 [Elasticomyces elasticus]|uniref:Uncharacterized protein n=1 Tax=Exophiala sideris TaxID=1016849 RepID=A0ABR0JLM7_9EURO|nr:hypothetical protein LTR10_016597 [Elasticomyces elasticus]KAK5035242.1 hypothetical protein LTS07_002678 [Exophiala sideris]KAK5039406.1 hypothetical protein LTR13_003663 [Exophiala sideris]KAK5066166.1 hypothetical protein LTR69_002684 [Exophiala sideris]KAK5186843.1 hypothetical protein LTR44_000849 [Eurotiomycetes sp. CCFEE 6388]
MFDLLKRRSKKSAGPQCPETRRERTIVFCDFGFHGRAANNGWEFTYVDEVNFDPAEDLRKYQWTPPDRCIDTLSTFAASQLRRNLKSSKGWRFVGVIEDRGGRIQRRERNPRTMLVFEREMPCLCGGTQHSLHKPSISKSSEVYDSKFIEYGPDDILVAEMAKLDCRRGSFSSLSSDGDDPPPSYRSRFSTLATLYEENDGT